jgi:hypothetical protein
MVCGQCPPYISKDNMAFAVYLPNDASRGNKNWRDNQYLMSVADLEQKLEQSGNDFDFFSNLPVQTRSQIKDRDYADIYNWITGGVYPLLAENEFSTTELTAIGSDTVKTSSWIIIPEIFDTNSISKITTNPDGTASFTSPLEIGISQISSSKDNIAKTTSVKVDVATVDITNKTGMGEIGFSQVSTVNINTTKFGTEETGFTEIDITHGTTTQMGTSQINTTEISPSAVANIDISKGEISSASSVGVQKFRIGHTFSIDHNIISRQAQNIELAAISLWQQQLYSTTPIDLNLAITNLPTGQLAEATITGYDTNGRPNAATISIDTDANGIGWFLDSTPGDNSEFQGAGEYFQATADSEAYGKYDLLTTILHETTRNVGWALPTDHI